MSECSKESSALKYNPILLSPCMLTLVPDLLEKELVLCEILILISSSISHLL